jgi:hypothetical protein
LPPRWRIHEALARRPDRRGDSARRRGRIASPGAPAASQGSTPFLPTPPAGAPQQLVVYAHIKSIAAKGGGFEARVDPAEYLSGETANRAAIADKVLQPGDTVPNDHYVRDESHRLLMYKITANAHVTVITAGLHATRIRVSELAQIVAGKNPKHRSLFEPKNAFWIRVASDTALALDQQYSP